MMAAAAVAAFAPFAFVADPASYAYRRYPPAHAPPLLVAERPGVQPIETVQQLEARLAQLAGAENRGKRRRLRERIERARRRESEVSTQTDVFGEAKAALRNVQLPEPLLPPPQHGPAAPPPLLRPTRPRQRSRSRSPPRGWSPNIAWRAISMSELRAHPAFIALPPASSVVPVMAADIRLFRQDSRQWWACHAGRISTSACASCLGVYEERSARLLGVPPSLRGHGKALDAHMRLASAVIGDLTMLHPGLWHGEEEREPPSPRAGVWRAAHNASKPFLAEYRKPRSGRPRGGDGTFRSVGQIRMAWGSVQEATSILAALNYFGRQNASVEEAGLQPLEALAPEELASLPSGLPPIGASPDAIVRWPDGRVEPFEVKNHAPFASNPRRRTDADAPPFELRDPGPYGEVAIWHVPQLYLHMLCLGRECSSALFMSASATKGINVFRLHRDQGLMERILGFVARFAAQYGGGAAVPPIDFFWGTDGYRELLEGLRRASVEHVELLAHIPDDEVQRGHHDSFFL